MTTTGRGQAILDKTSTGRRCPHQHSATATVAVVGLAVAAVAMAGFHRADAFFVAPMTPRLDGAGGCGSRRGAAAAASVCRGRGERVMVHMTDDAAAEGQRDKPQFVPSKEMTTSTKEILPPPDREAAMKMVAEREAKELAKGDEEDAAYTSADIQDLPQPPYHFRTPGEFGNDTLCTDPAWHTTLLAFRWLGLPYEVEHEDDEDEAMLEMGDEVYDDPEELLAGLPERVLLSDFVESLEPEKNAVAKLKPAWTTLHFNRAGKTDLDTDERRLNSCLEKIENILSKHGPARGPFLEGDDLTIGDLRLAVTTYHMLAAFDIEKQWTFPDKLVKLKAHMDLFHGMQMFHVVMPSREDLARKYAL
ncbi:unnamed protein product [Ectocarpus sp. 4 AP-2014]